jgi:nucleotide-binding universal stress UspA family protein
MTTGTGPARGIAVGVDGSDCSREALAWAVDEARVRDCPLTVVHAWYHPAMTAGFELAGYADPAALEAQARRVVDELVAPWRDRYSDLPIHLTVVDAPPLKALVDASRKVDLLVVGSRGRGGFAELMLGSTSHAVAHHAACPVVIVRRS